MNAFLGVPFTSDGEMKGMVGIANRPGGYSEQLIEELQPLDACATLIDGYRILKQKEHIKKQLKDTVLTLQRQNEKLNEFTYIVSHDVRKHAGNLKTLSYLLQNPGDEAQELMSKKYDSTVYRSS